MHAKPDQHIVIQVLCHVQQKLSVQLTPVDTKSKFLNVLSHARFQAGARPRWQGLIVHLFILPPADLHVIANSMQPHGDGVSLMLCTSSKASWFLNHALLLSELLHARPFKDGGGGDHMPLF